MEDSILLRVEGLTKLFPIRGGIFQRTVGYVRAVENVSFSIDRGETLGLVGESGCGKTTTGRSILRLIEPTSGRVYFNGIDITALNKKDLAPLRREMQIIFQDPYGSLNPRMTIGDIIGEGLEIHKIASGKEKERRIMELLEVVGLPPAYMRRYPHEFSGGQRQRIGIARALAVNPKFIVCDEPVSALDVSIQSQIINLLKDLQKQFELTYLFIAHDLSVVKYMSNKIAVMYLAKIVEHTTTEELFSNPKHPYTLALMSAIPVPDPDVKKQRIVLQGDLPSPSNPPKGCRFNTRCPEVMSICKEVEPELKDIGKEHLVACHLWN
ncbi:MAG TPA: ABC transporter ATP-binding protein [bacterium]|nr:ABC transporter ATP-binding protein [bacterium]